KSCVLLAGLNADGRTAVIERTPTRDHTERLLRWFGVEVETKTDEMIAAEMIEAPTSAAAHIVSLVGPARLAARACVLPGAISSAAFFLVAATLLPASELTIKDVGLNPTR